MILFPRFQGFVRTFVLICVGVFLLEELSKHYPLGGRLTYQDFVSSFGLEPALFFSGSIYQPLTWVFIHGNFTHLLFNMFAFWMFGSLIEEIWGTRSFVTFVFVSGILSGIIVALFGLVDTQSYAIPTIGASGVVFSILVAVSRIYPDQMVLVFFFFPMKMKYFAYLMIAIEFFALYNSNSHGISNIAHLGGAAVGYFYVTATKFTRGGRGGSAGSGDFWRGLKDRWHQRRMRKKLRVIRVDERTRYN